MKIDRKTAEQALYGGLILGAGGGGILSLGMENVNDAFAIMDYIEIRDIDDFKDDDVFVNVSVIGAPSAMSSLTNQHWFDALNIFNLNYPKGFQAIMGNENGPMATANGFVLSALTGIPMVDAPGSGRAVPMAPFTCMDLSIDPDYRTTHAMCGGKGNEYVCSVMQGAFGPVAACARHMSTQAGGMIYVLRNPVTKAYAKEHAAIGGLTQAIEIGETVKSCLGSCSRLIAVLERDLQIEVLGEGVIEDYVLSRGGGWDGGSFKVKCDNGTFEYTFWNEFMTVHDENGNIIAAFPELMHILDAETGMPYCSAEAKNGMRVVAIKAPAFSLKIGSGMRIEQNYARTEKTIGKTMIPYLKSVGILQ